MNWLTWWKCYQWINLSLLHVHKVFLIQTASKVLNHSADRHLALPRRSWEDHHSLYEHGHAQTRTCPIWWVGVRLRSALRLSSSCGSFNAPKHRLNWNLYQKSSSRRLLSLNIVTRLLWALKRSLRRDKIMIFLISLKFIRKRVLWNL